MITLTDKQKAIFSEVFKLTTPCNKTFIAGGSVVNLDLASDIDIWLGNKEVAWALLAKLPFYQHGNTQLYGESIFIGEGYFPPIDKIVQIIYSPNDMQSTLACFDITTHAHAVRSRDLSVFSEKRATLSIMPPLLLAKPRYKTLSRYIKICHRYGFTPNPNILHKIHEGVGTGEWDADFLNHLLAKDAPSKLSEQALWKSQGQGLMGSSSLGKPSEPMKLSKAIHS